MKRSSAFPAALVLACLLATSASAAAGDLDSTFGGDGRVLTRIDHEGSANAVAIQADGRIVVAGSARQEIGPRVFTVARYRTDGSLDPSFSGDGIQQTALGDESAEAMAIAIDQMGRITVAGSSNDWGEPWSVVRYEQDGSLDATFGSDGRVTVRFARHVLGPDDCCMESEFSDMALQTDGRIILAGTTADSSSDDNPDDDSFATLVRLDPNGSLDDTFGRNGKVFRRLNRRSFYAGAVGGMALLPGGQIVVVEDRVRYLNGNIRESRLVRYGGDGSFEGPFGDVLDSFYPRNELIVGDDGSIYALGSSHEGTWAVARFRPDGFLNASFSGDGLATTPFTGLAYGMAVQPDGRIVVVGFASRQYPEARFATVRFRAGGSLDRSFGGDGIVMTKLLDDPERAMARDVALQPDGRIVAVGSVARDNVRYRDRFAAVRMLAA